MIVLVGESGSGKTTVEKALESNGFNRIISYTTRPMRDYEVDGVHYHFISRKDFEKRIGDGFFAEWVNYNGNLYGTAKEDCKDNTVIVVEPDGLKQLQEHPDLKTTSFYLKVPPLQRLDRMISRGDNRIEAVNRLLTDEKVFKDIAKEVDFTVPNLNLHLTIQTILGLIEVNL